MERNIGIIGLGTVGQALFNQIQELEGFKVAGIAVKSASKARNADRQLITTNANELIHNPEVEVILEAIDDDESAFEYAKASLRLGKIYISANKKMVANNLRVLLHYATLYGGELLYEAAVGGAIPVLRTIREHLRNEPIHSIRGIVNGSCNYILTRMLEDELPFDQALRQAQELGFAESDPTLDVDAWDSYYKSILLSHTAFREYPNLERISMQGIRGIQLSELKKARRAGAKVKLVVSIESKGTRTAIEIAPKHVQPSDPLYSIDNELNGIVINGLYSGELLLQGPGAGGNPTASAMIGDLVNASKPASETLNRELASVH